MFINLYLFSLKVMEKINLEEESVFEKQVSELVGELSHLYPNVQKSDHQIIVETTLNHFFDKKSLMNWYANANNKFNYDTLKEIRSDPFLFFYYETHFTDEGYVLLRDR